MERAYFHVTMIKPTRIYAMLLRSVSGTFVVDNFDELEALDRIAGEQFDTDSG